VGNKNKKKNRRKHFYFRNFEEKEMKRKKLDARPPGLGIAFCCAYKYLSQTE
jgi:hypothetical protein